MSYNESGWLVEWARPNKTALWWDSEQCPDGWTTDSNKAIRFSRKVDAEKAMRLVFKDSKILNALSATDHEWM